jgi:hypothetical protein
VEIKVRKAAGSSCLFAVQTILHFRMMSRNVKLLIYKTIIRTVVTYASETWVLTKENERALSIREIKITRKIYDPLNEGGQRRIRTNAELQEL